MEPPLISVALPLGTRHHALTLHPRGESATMKLSILIIPAIVSPHLIFGTIYTNRRSSHDTGRSMTYCGGCPSLDLTWTFVNLLLDSCRGLHTLDLLLPVH